MLRLIFLALALLLAANGYACTPLPWTYGRHAKKVSEYAQTLLNYANSIVVAKVISAETISELPLGMTSRAEIAVTEQIKGPTGVRRLHNVGFGTCGVSTYT